MPPNPPNPPLADTQPAPACPPPSAWPPEQATLLMRFPSSRSLRRCWRTVSLSPQPRRGAPARRPRGVAFRASLQCPAVLHEARGGAVGRPRTAVRWSAGSPLRAADPALPPVDGGSSQHVTVASQAARHAPSPAVQGCVQACAHVDAVCTTARPRVVATGAAPAPGAIAAASARHALLFPLTKRWQTSPFI